MAYLGIKNRERERERERELSCLPLQSGIVGFSLSFVAPKKLLNLWRRNKINK